VTCLVIAHRGASGYRPEHTLEAYRLAIALGADFIEPDLVLTADGVLVARHENEISATTDVADHPEFAHRRQTKLVDGRSVDGWFVEDFTLAELQMLRARERLSGPRLHNQVYDGLFTIPTFDEIIDLVRMETGASGRPVGVYPEIKQPAYFADHGLRHEDALLAALHRAGPEIPALIQCFDPTVLRRLASRTAVPLVQLVARASSLLTPYGLREVSTYAQGIGAEKSLLVSPDPTGRLGGASDLVERAHDAGLAVHAWTFRNENVFLPPELRRGTADAGYGDAASEYAVFRGLGVDGVFTDHPDTAVAALAQPALS
jgi:glycerophosphoryl diester phosphodiesterase